jgi:hypothetical protein
VTIPLGVLYHWAPTDRRVDILRDGLKVYSDANSADGHCFPYICLGTTPSAAWGYSGDMPWAEEVEEWDLYQVNLIDTDDVFIRSDLGPYVIEVRVNNSVHAERIWLVGTRQGDRHHADVIEKPKPKKKQQKARKPRGKA